MEGRRDAIEAAVELALLAQQQQLSRAGWAFVFIWEFNGSPPMRFERRGSSSFEFKVSAVCAIAVGDGWVSLSPFVLCRS